MANENLMYVGTRIDFLDSLPNFDIRNGPPEAAVSLLVRPAIPRCYKWIPISNMPPARAKSFTDAYIAEQLQYFRESPPTYGGVALTEAQVRKAAIVLGAIRAISTTFYRLGNTDLIAGEVEPSKLEYVAPRAATATDAAVNEGLRFKPDVPAATRTRMTAALALTEQERAVLTGLIPQAVGIIPLQGFSLLSCGHHYISTAGHVSFKACLAVERACWKNDTWGDWFTSDEAMLRDIMWHKSCHPVNLSIKERAAANVSVKEQLLTVGAGAAAARLPASEAAVRSADAYLQLFQTLRNMFEQFEGGIDTKVLEEAVRALRSFLPGEAGPVEGYVRDPVVPAYVVDRRTCMRWLEEVVNRNQAVAAQCFGFYCAMGDAGQAVGTGGHVDSLRNAFSLKKLQSSHIPNYTLGYQSYQDYVAAKNKQRQRATYVAPFITIN